eukprot:GFYU01001293.1.p1 GENE.GFYU01001293.1~~GFYU01001293.1.p1  ORF type:complete len:385 (+),score=62.85 GFYU01001293.1:128-1282(+)
MPTAPFQEQFEDPCIQKPLLLTSSSPNGTKLANEYDGASSPQDMSIALTKTPAPATVVSTNYAEPSAWPLEDATAPFKRVDAPFPTSMYFNMIFGAMLLPFRLVLLVSMVVSCYIWIRICTIGVSDYNLPLSPTRRFFMRFGRYFGRFCMVGCGIWFYSRNGHHISNKDKRAPIIVSNHTSYLDILVILYEAFPSWVAKAEVRDIPLVGHITASLNGLFTDRSQSAHRTNVAQAIMTRMKLADQYPPLLVFPEGTTTNGTHLLHFHKGAFLAGVPVQPCVIRYPFGRFSPAFTSMHGGLHLLFLMCQPINYLEVQWLPVYYPSPQEERDATVFASNVQKVMARALGVPTTNLTNRDQREFQMNCDTWGMLRPDSTYAANVDNVL